MYSIRRNTFETNSSSTHSISLLSDTRKLECSYLEPDDDGYVHVSFDDYGWEVEDYTYQHEKLSYLVTMCAMVNGYYPTWSQDDEYYDFIDNCDDLDDISKAVAKHANCKGIIVDRSEGYIDHQSCEDYHSLQDYLDECGLTIEEFIFGDVVVHTDNDNH